MSEILFVHGTGVRRISYDAALSVVRAQSERHLNGAKVRPCLWGEPEGAKLRLGGASIPTYDDHPPAALTDSAADEIERVTWRMLREDPLFEVRLLENLPTAQAELGPFENNPGEVSWRLVRDLAAPPQFLELLSERGLEKYWIDAHAQFVEHRELESILIKANRDSREVSRALARGVVANLINVAAANGHPAVSRDTVDRLVDLLIQRLGERALAPFDWITKPLAGLARRCGTYKARRERRALSDAAYPVAGDIVLYQKDGSGIRQFIKDRIADAPGELIVFAHSLGGIAMVDLLVMEDHSAKVKGLLTVGSQSSLLYELGALKSLEFGQRLPDHFPKKWLNIYDPNDFLSYACAGVFGTSTVADLMVKSKMPFPDSHGAYWDQDAVWQAIKGYFPWR